LFTATFAIDVFFKHMFMLIGYQFISDVVTCSNLCEKYVLHTNVVGVEIDKCHMVTERCTRQPAQTAEMNVMFHSNQTVAGQFTAANVMQKEDHHEDTKRKLLHL